MAAAAMAVLVPIGVTAPAAAQSYMRPSYGQNVIIVPPSYPGYPAGDDTGGGPGLPFLSPQAGQQRLLEMLDTGGIERPARSNDATPPGCVYSGQIYSEGAIIRSDAGRQVCGPRAGVEPDASGQTPLAWQAVPGG